VSRFGWHGKVDCAAGTTSFISTWSLGRDMRASASILVALLVVLAGCSALDGSSNATDTPETTAPTDEMQTTAAQTTQTTTDGGDQSGDLADPEEDVLGWEDGYWYNESITVDRSDGLNDTELERVVSRSMARVEQVRGLEFESRVPVEIISREEYREQVQSGNTTTADRLHQNVKWEAMLMVDESTDAIAVQNRNSAGGVGGYYTPSEEQIVIISDSETPEMDEITLSQELFHGLQDQRFDISSFDQSTQELHNARDGIIEGDGNLVDQRYQERCESDWDCLMPQQQQGGGGSSDIHLGLYQVSFQPYSDGVLFVQQLYERGGWDAVNAVYQNPPASTEQTIHPDRYPDETPSYPTVEDRSNDDWQVLGLEDANNYASFGEAGLYVMFWYPSYQTTQATGQLTDVVIPYQNHLNYDGQQLNQTDPFNYDHPITDGWAGDRLVPYVTDDSPSTNETGYVWQTEWDSESDASEFADAYRDLLDHHDAQAVSDRANTYLIDDGAAYGDAYYVVQQGTSVVIVNAPTVDGLSGVRSGAGTTNASVVAA